MATVSGNGSSRSVLEWLCGGTFALCLVIALMLYRIAERDSAAAAAHEAIQQAPATSARWQTVDGIEITVTVPRGPDEDRYSKEVRGIVDDVKGEFPNAREE